jgi:hypothetical protein
MLPASTGSADIWSWQQITQNLMISTLDLQVYEGLHSGGDALILG